MGIRVRILGGLCTLVLLCGFVQKVCAAAIYVDQTLPTNISNGTYSIEKRDNSGSDGNAYKTIAGAISAMNGGDDIYLRGGTYYERDIYINNPAKNGSAAKHSTIQSFPGEWAIIDGQRLCASTPRAIFFHSAGTPLEYWKFERLEITGGGSTTSTDGAGLRFYRSKHVVIRWCYIHDNLSTSHGGNPAGVYANVPRNMLIEYCYFKNNGSPGLESHNCANIALFSDYRDTTPNDFNAEIATRENEVRYNVLEGSGAGFKHKNQQIFGEQDRSPLDMTYKTWGDKIHHNIVMNTKFEPILAEQDFCQVYQNIIVNRDYATVNSQGKDGIAINLQGDAADVYNNCVYNNTLIRGSISFGGESKTNIEEYGFCANNIIVAFRGYELEELTFKVFSTGGVIDMSHMPVNRNYVYDSRQYFSVPMTEVKFASSVTGGGSKTLGVFDATYLFSNYIKAYSSDDQLFKDVSGASSYKTRPNHVVKGTTMIQDGGTGGVHPYLAGVAIPSFIGATGPTDSGPSWDPNNPDPNDAGWVDYLVGTVWHPIGVKNLRIKSIQ